VKSERKLGSFPSAACLATVFGHTFVSGFEVVGLGFRVGGVGFRVENSGFRV